LVEVSQTGALPEQSAELRHSTHVFALEHRGEEDGQSESCVHGGFAASTGGAVEHSWSIQTKPSSHGRVVSITPNALQSAGDVQHTTGFGFEHAAIPAASTPRNINRIRAACPSEAARVNEAIENGRG
jgi:hypothetical protein